METSPKQKDTLRRRALKGAGTLVLGAALAATATFGGSRLPARGPDAEEDCRSKLDGITETYRHGNYHRYELTRMTGKAACTNEYMRMNRTDDHDGSFVKQIAAGEERVLCWDPNYPDQLQIQARKFERDYVHISPRLQHQIEDGNVEVPRC